jgi:hypothetical protein
LHAEESEETKDVVLEKGAWNKGVSNVPTRTRLHASIAGAQDNYRQALAKRNRKRYFSLLEEHTIQKAKQI